MMAEDETMRATNRSEVSSYPFAPEDIVVERREVGRDVLFVIRGGAEHIGAVSTAYAGDAEITVETIAVPGHKEHLLSEPIARRAAESLRRTVTVVMGIHYDDMTREQIAEVSGLVFRLFEKVLNSPEQK